MIADILPVRAWLRLSWIEGDDSATLSWTAGDGGADGAWAANQPDVTGQFVVADGCVNRLAGRDIADVICHMGPSRCAEPSAWLGEMLGRYPGCAVASAGLRGQDCAVAVRGESPVMLAVDGKASTGCRALLCASFVHAWLAAGLPLKALTPARLRVGAVAHSVSLRSIRGTVTPISFGICLINQSHQDLVRSQNQGRRDAAALRPLPVRRARQM
jgi:hypothetical protein